jgi:RHS repeat-associated protein
VTIPLSVQAGQAITLAAAVTSGVTQTGAYNWSATVTLTFANQTTTQVSTSGTAVVVARDGSPYGAGWWIDGLDQLYAVTGGVLWVTGAGDSRFFTAAGGGTFISPAEDFGTLVQNGNGTYTYTAKDKTLYNFTSGGLLANITDTHGLALSYSYDGLNRLSQVQAPDGGITTLSYDPSSGVLASVNEPGSRSVVVQHDGSGNLTFLTDAAGFTRTLGYDANHHATSDSWAPLAAAFSYDSYGHLTQVNQGLGSVWTVVSVAAQGLGSAVVGPAWASLTDGNNHKTSFLLDQRARLLEQVQPDGATDTYVRDAAGQVIAAIDPLLRVTLYSYVYGSYNSTLGGGDGDLVKVTYADGSFDAYRYDPTFHHVTQTSNALREVSSNTYDPTTGDLLTSTDARGSTTTNVWSNGLLVSSTDPRGITTDNYYDADRRLIESTDGLGAPTFFLYDSAGNPSGTLDAFLRPTQTVYNGDNELVSTLDANGDLTNQTYDAYGLVTSDTNARRFTATTTYDQRGWVTQSTDFTGATTTDYYDAAGNLIQETDPRNDSTYFSYDVDNRQTGTLDPLGFTTSATYDLAGEELSSTDQMGRTSYEAYDVLGQVVATQDPLVRTDYTFYDAAGNDFRNIDARGFSTYNFYDADNEEIGSVDARGGLSLMQYDRDGNVIARRDALGLWTNSIYDADNRAIATTDPTGATVRSLFNAVGDLTQSLDARGKISKLFYDNVDQQIGTLDPNNDLTQVVLDADGNAIQSLDAKGAVSYASFDGDDRLTAAQDADHDSSSEQLDANSNVTSVSDTLGGQLTSVFDAAQRLTSRQFSGPNNQQARLDVGSTGDGQIATLTRSSNVSGTMKVGVTQNTYDDAGNITHIQHQNGSNSTLLDLTYNYDTDNRLSSQTVPGTTTNFGYDRDSQLTSAGGTNTTFDANGNRTSTGYQTGVDNRLLTDGTWTYSYDAVGNITSKRNIQTGETWTYSYDLDNKETSATHKDASGNVLNSETLKYDVFGQLIEQDVTNGSTTVTRFALDLDGNVWADLNGSNQLQMRRLYLDGPNAVFARIDGSGNVSWYLADHLGSIVGLTNASGSLSDQLTYDAWGNFTETQSATGDRDKFATYQYDVIQGNYYADARRYNPATGRFESPDPSGFSAGDDNLNRYTDNGPTNAIDPSGLADDPTRSARLLRPVRCAACHNPVVMSGGSISELPLNYQLAAMQWYGVGSPGKVDLANHKLRIHPANRFARGAAEAGFEASKGYTLVTAPAQLLYGLATDPRGVANGFKEKLTEDPFGFAGAVAFQLAVGKAFGELGAARKAGPAEYVPNSVMENIARSHVPAEAPVVPKTAGATAASNAAKAQLGSLSDNGFGQAYRTPAPGKLVNCFPPDTLVGTESGLRPMSPIGAGERVWGYDFLNGVWRLCRVECRHDANYDGPLVTLYAEGGKVTATTYHPFWVIQGDDLPSRPTPRHVGSDEDQGGSLPGRWVNSHDLREGDVVFLMGRGPVTVRRVVQGHEQTPVCNLTVEELHTFAVGEMQVLVHNASGTGGMPQIGKEIGRGAEGVVYENLDQPGMVVKEFHKSGTSPLQARNEFQNLETARAVSGRADNVVKAQAPADPRQGWIVKEHVIRDTPPTDLTERTRILQDFDNAGVQDARGNLIFGHTADNATPRWILIE